MAKPVIVQLEGLFREQTELAAARKVGPFGVPDPSVIGAAGVLT